MQMNLFSRMFVCSDCIAAEFDAFDVCLTACIPLIKWYCLYLLPSELGLDIFWQAFSRLHRTSLVLISYNVFCLLCFLLLLLKHINVKKTIIIDLTYLLHTRKTGLLFVFARYVVAVFKRGFHPTQRTQRNERN